MAIMFRKIPSRRVGFFAARFLIGVFQILCVIVLGACASSIPVDRDQGIGISNVRVGEMSNGVVIPSPDGGRLPYSENYACIQDSASVPCMMLGFSFDLDWVGQKSNLICSVSIKGDPAGMPLFAEYKDGEIQREFIVDAEKLKSNPGPFVAKTTIIPDMGDSGQMVIGWACRNSDKLLVKRTLLVDVPVRKDGIPVAADRK